MRNIVTPAMDTMSSLDRQFLESCSIWLPVLLGVKVLRSHVSAICSSQRRFCNDCQPVESCTHRLKTRRCVHPGCAQGVTTGGTWHKLGVSRGWTMCTAIRKSFLSACGGVVIAYPFPATRRLPKGWDGCLIPQLRVSAKRPGRWQRAPPEPKAQAQQEPKANNKKVPCY